MTSFSRNFFTINSRGLAPVLVLVAVSMLAGCDEKEKSSQVAAKVNSEEITVSQVNGGLAAVPFTPGKTLEEAKKEVLESLIVQKLAVQQAVKMKLDRTPNVMQAIESAKNTILARAYMDPIVSGVAKPTALEVHKFYVEHPELFANRHIYSLRELEMETKPELAASIKEMVGKNQSLDAMAAWLKEKNIAATIQEGVKPAEQLPMEMVGRLSKMSAGQSMVIEMKNTISVLQLVGMKAEPIEETVATPFVQEFLSNAGKKEALDKEIKSLKTAAKIEYVADLSVKAAPVAATQEKPVAQSAVPDVTKSLSGLK